VLIAALLGAAGQLPGGCTGKGEPFAITAVYKLS
jgi:hypothetical protein